MTSLSYGEHLQLSLFSYFLFLKKLCIGKRPFRYTLNTPVVSCYQFHDYVRNCLHVYSSLMAFESLISWQTYPCFLTEKFDQAILNFYLYASLVKDKKERIPVFVEIFFVIFVNYSNSKKSQAESLKKK